MKRTSSKDGIALIVVLGFLSLMVVMAVMFVGRARVERLVGDSTLAAMSARSVLRAGIAQGMNAYSRYLWDDSVIMPAGKEEYEIYLSGDTKDTSRYEYSPSGIGEDVDLLGEYGDEDKELARYWIPERYWDVDVGDARWIYQKAWDQVAKKDRIVGRYAYAIFDVSGGIDVNLLGRVTHGGGEGGTTNRSNVRYFTESAANCLEDVTGAMGVCDLVVDYGGFDSFFEMRKNLSRYIDLDNLNNVAPYSMSAFRGTSYRAADGDWTQPVNAEDLSEGDWMKLLSGTEDRTHHRSSHQMKDELAAFAGPRPEAVANRQALAKALMDFTSSGVKPQGLDYPSVKDVPMLNEIQFKARLKEETHPKPDEDHPAYSTYTLEVSLDLETWFPFPVSENEGGKFSLSAPALHLVPRDWTGGLRDDAFNFKYALGPATGYTIVCPRLDKAAGDHAVTASWNEGQPQTNSIAYELPLAATCSGNGWPDTYEPGWLPPGLTLALQPVSPGKDVYPAFSVAYGGDVVDKVDKLNLFQGVNTWTVKKGEERVKGWEVADPRMNHLPKLWSVSEEADKGLGWRNPSATNAFRQSSPLLRNAKLEAGDFAMFCRNGPLETPGDLGFVPVMGARESYSDAWKTFDLFSLDAAWLMRQFVSKAEADYTRTNPLTGRKITFPDTLPVYTNGTINPNTPLTNVLQAAFCDLTAVGIPGWDNKAQNKKELSATEAEAIASRIIGYRSKGGYDNEEALGDGYDFAAGSDWVTAFADDIWHSNLEGIFRRESDKKPLPKNIRESLVRQTWGLFRPEDNLFVMIVVGQSIKEGPTGTLGSFDEDDDMVVGEKRAALLVWRDPFPVGDNPHMEMSTVLYKALID